MVTRSKTSSAESRAIVWTEGKTDWKHLKKAYAKLGLNLGIGFRETESGDLGGQKLLSKCETLAETPQIQPMIFVFDHDDPSIIGKVSDDKRGYKNWGNNVFSFALPFPGHRKGFENLCIELYYRDVDLKTEDDQGRRIFLTSEFNEKSGGFLGDPTTHVGTVGRIKGYTEPTKAKILDSDVFRDDRSVSLSKSNFADYVNEDYPLFSRFSFVEFQGIFDLIQAIISNAEPKINVALPDLIQFNERVMHEKSPAKQLSDVFAFMLNVLELIQYIFIASTIRTYEDIIISSPIDAKKKVEPIKKVISERFTSPSFATLMDLTRYCYHLVNDTASDELQQMKIQLQTEFLIGPLGDFLDDLEKLYPSDPARARIMNKSQLRKNLFDYVIPEFAKYEPRLEQFHEDIENLDLELRPDLARWLQALDVLVSAVLPIASQVFILESVTSTDPLSRTYTVTVRTYRGNTVNVTHREVSFEELEDYDRTISSLVLTHNGTSRAIRLFPFILIKDDALYFYRRTRTKGYEYYSLFGRGSIVEPTNRKFSRYLFSVAGYGSQQALFFADPQTIVNETNGVRAKVPSEGDVLFVGRTRQLATIRKEIIEIPNQNGIVYGLGGVGKTALMLELSSELLKEENPDRVLFNNIIWVSAKNTYYNPMLDLVEPERTKFQSLDDVLTKILAFFDFEDLEGYPFEDKKWFVLELLEQNRVLLILDNFETVPPPQKQAIIKFFEVEVKYALKRKPQNFKIIITSRELIPSGFHQIALNGLGLTEAKQLMSTLYPHYRSGRPDLSDEQKEELHKVTLGIPIIIKHCFGQIFEYNQPISLILGNLSGVEPNRAVDFSFEEIFRLLREDPIQLEMILLLEIVHIPLLVRQLAETLERAESEIEIRIPSLLSFQCIKTFNEGQNEKYSINDEIRLMTRRLMQQNSDLAQQIRTKILRNLTIEKQMDYTTEEANIVQIFEKYLSEQQYLEAEELIEQQIKAKPQSILLKYHYAKYLRDTKRDMRRAIDLLEGIREHSNNHPSILRVLISCFMASEIPDFQGASVFVQQMERNSLDNETLKLELAEFYLRWSTSIKMKRELSADPIDEMKRRMRYKDLADHAIGMLNKIVKKSHYELYMLAHAYFNKWDYEHALDYVEQAIELCNTDQRDSTYRYLRELIVTQQEKFPVRARARSDLSGYISA